MLDRWGRTGRRTLDLTARLMVAVGVIVPTSFVLAANPAQAAPVPTYTWSGGDANSGGSVNWSDGANWVGGLAPVAPGPVNLVFPSPAVSCGSSCRSTNDISGLTAASITTAGQSTAGDSLNLTGPLTTSGNVSLVDLNLAEPSSPTWTFTGQDVTFGQVTGVPVTIMLAGGSQLTGTFQTSGLAVEGASPTAAPASNGTIEGSLGPVGTYFADVAMNWQVGLGIEGPFATSGVAFNFTTFSSTRFPTTQVLNVDGPIKFDPASTITFNGALVVNPVSSLGPEVWGEPALNEIGSGTINLNGVNLVLAGGCGNAAATLVSSTPGVVGSFDQVVGGKEVAIPNNAIVTESGPCYERITYTSTSVTGTPVDPPEVSMFPSGHTPSIPNQAVTFTAIASGPITGGTMSFASNGTPITGCTAAPVNTTTGKATCSAPFSAPGNFSITASYSGDSDTPPGGPSAPITQVVVPAPTATIATPYEYLTGQQIAGTASDIGGPGVLDVLVYYINRVTGVEGDFVATCASCGVTQTSVTWDVPVTLTGPVGAGIYSFIAQAIDANDNFGPGSNTNTAFVVN
jgi:hypothetical protein